MEERLRIIKQILNTLFYRIIGIVISSLRLFIATKNFSDEGYGIYSLLTAFIGPGVYIFGLSIYSYLNRSVPGQTKEKQISLLKTLLFLETGFSIIFVLLITATPLSSFICSKLHMSQYQLLFNFTLAFIVIQIIASDINRYISALKEIEYANFVSFFASGFWILLLGLLWVLGSRITLWLFFIIWAFGNVASIIVGLYRVNVGNLSRARFDTTIIKSALLFSLPMVLVSVGTELINSSTILLISYKETVSSPGILGLAYRPLQVVMDYVIGISSTVFVPYLIESHNIKNEDRKNYFLSIIIKYTLLVALPIMAGLVIGRYDVLTFLRKSGEDITASAQLIPIYVFLPIINVFIYPFHYGLFLSNKTLLLGGIYVLCGIVNIVLNNYFIPIYSYYGAAAITVISQGLVLVFLYLFARRSIHLKWDFIRIGRLFVITVVTSAAAFFIYPYLSAIPWLFVRLSVFGCIILLLYIPGLFIASVFNENELDVFRKIKRKAFEKLPVNFWE